MINLNVGVLLVSCALSSLKREQIQFKYRKLRTICSHVRSFFKAGLNDKVKVHQTVCVGGFHICKANQSWLENTASDRAQGCRAKSGGE